MKQAALPRLVVLLSEGYGVNYLLLRDVIDQFGWQVTRAGLTNPVPVCQPFAAPRGALPMPVDVLIHDATDLTRYDAVVLISATQFADTDPYADFLGDPHVLRLVSDAVRGGLPVFASCAVAPDGGFLVCGITKSPEGNNDITLARLDARGAVVSTRTVGGPGSDWGCRAYEARDGSWFVVGSTTSAGAGLSDVLLMALEGS